jgi:hypothetical protein
MTEAVRNPGGKPRKDTYRRKELWEARKAARMLLEVWEAKGRAEEVVSQKAFGALVAGLSTEDQARVNKWFPLVIAARRPNKWNLGILRSVLAWDDPVVMLGTLVRSDPGAWWDVLKDAEENACTQAQEEAIRWAYSDLIQAGPTVPGDSRLVDCGIWKENKDRRFNT